MKSVVFGLLLASFGLAPLAPASAEPAPAPDSTQQPEEPAAPRAPETPQPEPASGRPVLDTVLPCGTRVLVARDDSLPVAALVLALERGSEDDPAELPGLHHALAYQLLMGNRDVAPGGIAAMVQDAGGIAFLATGPAQIRYEALIPVTLLDDLIHAESRRFRAPTVTSSLWKEALVSAKRDSPMRRTASWAATAVAHGAPGLAHRPRMVPGQLGELDENAVEAALASRARYERATLVVVAPLPLEDTMAKVEAALADLPDRDRDIQARAVEPSAPMVEQAKATGSTFVWGVPGDPASRLWADAWCEALSRQRRTKGEPKPNRVRCAFDDDPRRPSLTVRVRTPDDPTTLLAARLEQLGSAGSRQVRAQRKRLRRALEAENSTPLGLARRLAAAAPRAPGAPDRSSVERLTGADALDATPIPVDTLFDLDRAVHIVPSKDTPRRRQPPADPAPKEPTP